MLGPNFALENMPCYQRASSSDIQKLHATVTYVLQPIRDAFGPVIVSSWKWWDNGCTLRTGSAHEAGGTVDFVTPNANLSQVFTWGVLHLPRWYVGRWIYEPAFPAELDSTGNVVKPAQGLHIHMAPIADMVKVFGLAYNNSAAYVETSRGVYTPVPGWGPGAGTASSPLELPGLTVSVSKPTAQWAPAAIGLLVGLYVIEHLRHS